MLEFIPVSLFTLATTTFAFYAGVKLTERHYREKEEEASRSANLTRIFFETHDVARRPSPGQNPSMAAPVPMPPAGSRFREAFSPDGPIQARLDETGQATYLFPGKNTAQ